ncbi:hypothetical protein NHQ30_011174 [Ciborinia camelliae]|nr:hypothetical protein NHQ30_011174 [Ciborinia camelliae]
MDVRCRIWNYARARTIGIIISHGVIFSRSPSPITFRINRESRHESQKRYKIHPMFYIWGTQYDERIPYPFYDPDVDSVVLINAFMGCNPSMSTAAFGFYGATSGISPSPFDIIQSLHIPAHAWEWGLIRRAPRADIRFVNLTEIVFQGGQEGLIKRKDIERCKEVVRGCFEKGAEDIADEQNGQSAASLVTSGLAINAKAGIREIKVPEVRICMPNGLGYEWMFEEEKLGMESLEERRWVMNFIKKVKADRCY